MKRAARLALILAALAVPTVAPRAASAQQPTKAARDEAGVRFKKGIDLFKDGDYQTALIEFRRAYDLAPNFNVLYNIGQVSFQLQDYAAALGSLEKYLAEGGSQVPQSRRDDVKKDIDKLRGRVANVDVSTNLEGAEILIDEVLVGKTPLAKPVLVSAGRRRITATKEGRIPASKVLEVAGGDNLRVQLDLAEPAPGQAIPPPPTDSGVTPPPPASGGEPEPVVAPIAPISPEPQESNVPWAGWALTAGFGLGAVVCGAVALGASSDLDAMRTSSGQTRQGLDDQKSKTVTLALVTDILAGAAIVAGGVSLYLTVSGGGSRSDSAQPAKAPNVKVGVTPTGVQVLGSF